MSSIIYINDFAGNIFVIHTSPTSLPSNWYDHLCKIREEWKNKRDHILLLRDHPDDPYDLSNITNESKLRLFVLDDPFRERWGQQTTILKSHIRYDRYLLYWDCEISEDIYMDPFVYQTHCTLPLYILSKQEGIGFSASSSDFMYQETVTWSNTLREALVRYQTYTNKGAKEGYIRMSDEVVDHIICLWYKHRKPTQHS
jgi:hypothetical protein